jgi:putative ABC transport system permease protein
VATQREQIAVIKAFGYSDRAVGVHYAKIVALVAGPGAAAGVLVAGSLGAAMTRLYARYFRFPELPLALGATEVIEGLAISAVAATLGAWAAIRRTVVLPPAEAMRPEAPLAYRPALLERLGFARLVPPIARMVVREIERRPLRSLLTVAGISAATGLTVFNAFTFDSVRHMLNVQFGLTRREDVHLTFSEPRSTGALSAVRKLPGVVYAEPFRAVPARIRAGLRARRVAIEGMPERGVLQALLDAELRPLAIPSEGLVVSRKLAEILGVSAGDHVTVEVLEGRRRTVSVPIARIAETFVGISAYMRLASLGRVLGEGESMDGAWLLVDDGRTEALHARVKEVPLIASVMERDRMLHSARRLLDEHVGTWIAFGLSFALVMAMGVLYNAVRVTLAERARELASLRVLGFRRGEVCAILFGQLALLLLVAVPLGLGFGWLLAAALVRSPGFNTEQFRLPLVISPATYAIAVATVLVGAILSSWTAWRKLDAMDIVEALKARD